MKKYSSFSGTSTGIVSYPSSPSKPHKVFPPVQVVHNDVGSSRVVKNGKVVGAIWPTAFGGFAYGDVSPVGGKGCTGEVLNSKGTADTFDEAVKQLS